MEECSSARDQAVVEMLAGCNDEHALAKLILDTPSLRILARTLAAPFPEGGVDATALIQGVWIEICARALRQAGGNQSHAARLLRVKRDKLRYTIKMRFPPALHVRRGRRPSEPVLMHEGSI